MTPEQWQHVRQILHKAIELDPLSRAAYLKQIADEDSHVGSEVEGLIESYKDMRSDFMSTASFPSLPKTNLIPDSMIGRRLGPYQIVELIGSGGMGYVFRAIRVDKQFEKEVAIKFVRADLNSQMIIGRFKNERQILASLDHPNIAHLLDGDVTDQGTPYLVMELIHGHALDTYRDREKLTLEQRLHIFLQVCSAVQYAHQRLVIHRDIKPSNIIVTSQGIPKLLDFGIAKILDPTVFGGQIENATTVFRPLTPGYASPEQVRGIPVTTSTDIYSLGVVLYELLAGQHPYPVHSLSPGELAVAVCEITPDKPSRMIVRRKDPKEGELPASGVTAKDLKGDLDNIVLMALRKEPHRRYSSVEQFAEDIKRHITNLPVIACRDTAAYRLSKFMVRHRAMVAAAAIVTITLFMALVVTVNEARIAKRRFDDLHTLANSLIFEIHDSIQDLSGSTAARKLIVTRALQYLDGLALQAHGDVRLQRELAAGYKRIGDVQGYQFAANLGDTAGALKSYQKALVIQEALAAKIPGNFSERIALAEILRVLAETTVVSNQTRTALNYIHRALEITEDLQHTNPKNAGLLSELSIEYEAEGDILYGSFNLSNIGDVTRGRVAREKALAASEQWVQVEPQNPFALRRLAVSRTKIGDHNLLVGNRHAAQEYYSQAQHTFEDLLNKVPGNKSLEALHGIYTRVEFVQLANADAENAVLTDQKSVSVSERMVSADADDVHAKLNLAVDSVNLADALSQTPKRAQAVSVINRAKELMQQLIKINPGNSEFLGVQLAQNVTAGDVWRRLGKNERSLEYYRTASIIASQIRVADPDNVDAIQRSAGIYVKLGLALARLHDYSGATAMYREALELAEPAEKIPSSEQPFYTSADSYAGLGQIELMIAQGSSLPPLAKVEHLQKSQTSLQHSLEIWKLIKEPGLLDPDGFESVPPNIVRGWLIRCSSELAAAQRKHG